MLDLFLSLLTLLGCVWQVRRWLRRAEDRGFVAGWNAWMEAEQRRQERQRKGPS